MNERLPGLDFWYGLAVAIPLAILLWAGIIAIVVVVAVR